MANPNYTQNKLLFAIDRMHPDEAEGKEELDRLKDGFLSSISHELRSPLLNMKMAIHLLRNAKNSINQERYLEILQAECEREISLINNLLDLQQLEAGSYPQAVFELLDLPDWLPNILEPIRCRTDKQSQILQINLSTNLPPLVTDSIILRRILIELLNNACKFTPTDGDIILSICHEQQVIGGKTAFQQLCSTSFIGSWFRSSELKGIATFTIRNQAEIPQSELSRVFEKFYRVPQIDPCKQGGTGLGLALVQRLVGHIRGKIQVESSGGWTTFRVWFTD